MAFLMVAIVTIKQSQYVHTERILSKRDNGQTKVLQTTTSVQHGRNIPPTIFIWACHVHKLRIGICNFFFQVRAVKYKAVRQF